MPKGRWLPVTAAPKAEEGRAVASGFHGVTGAKARGANGVGEAEPLVGATAPVLVCACGNRARGDDGLALALAEELAGWGTPGVEVSMVGQFVPELALELAGRTSVLFIDADAAARVPARLEVLRPARISVGFSHRAHPAEVLMAWRMAFRRPPPPAFLLRLKGVWFGLRPQLSDQGMEALSQGREMARAWLREQIEQSATSG